MRLLVVFLLGFSSGIPLSLTGSTLQSWFAQSGSSIMMTSLLSLIGLPYVYRMLWAPLLDKYTLYRCRRRKSWIITSQLLICVGLNVLACFTPATTPKWIGGIALLIAC